MPCGFFVVMRTAERLQVARVEPERIIQPFERDTMVDIVCDGHSVLLEAFTAERFPAYVGGA